VRMQPQTMNAATIAQKIQSCACCIVVFSVALTPLQAIIRRSAYQVLRNSSGNFVMFSATRAARGHAVLINYRKVVTLSQSSHDVRHYLRTCWRRVERNLPIIIYASVSNFSHSYASHSFTLSRLPGFVEDELLKLVGSLAFLCHGHSPSANEAATRVALATSLSSRRSGELRLW